MKDARVVIECGCYEGPRLHREVEFNFPCWQLVYALISLGSQDYQPSLKDNVQMRPFSMKYQPKGAGENFVEEKGTTAIQTNIKIKAPLWGFVAMASPDGSAHVHPVCKRRGFCNKMLINFSSEGSTVLDFFSEGVFVREALMLQRDVIYFVNSKEEAEFVGKYGKSLVSYSERNEKASFVFDEVFTTNALERLGPLALIQMSVCPAPDFLQMDNPLVKPSDLLPRKLLILDVEGLLLYAEGFMDRTSKIAAGDVIGAKKVIRRNGVQEFITRCFEMFDIALWTCSDRNLLYDYTYYLFSGEQYGKFLFMWDQGKALDTNERWTRNHREIRLLLKPLKTTWETLPDFNARNTLLVDVNPYRASANPEDTGIFLCHIPVHILISI
ncbi:hypothetical protein R1sor_007023 [Riccia sorocarpa]|uniref:FCP1 homology domain-containing protein n=1 Tax=Riccia sorocarpa TaxID=122646 RepID=A0ABD3HSS1_9MARC